MLNIPANSPPAFKISKSLTLEYLPSGSGIAAGPSSLYIVGDDSPYLFELDENLQLLRKHLLLEGFASEGRIPKPDKPDLESIAVESTAEGSLLYLFGSGSQSPERDQLVIFDTRFPEQIKRYTLDNFYDLLVVTNGKGRETLNLEGAFIQGEQLFLLNRAGNQLIKLLLKDFKEYLEGRRPPAELRMDRYSFLLPEKAGVQAGFSDACPIPGTTRVVFTATLEDTPNWIADGEILGSYLGLLDTRHLADGKPLFIELVKDQHGKPLPDKLEGVAFDGFDEKRNLKLLLTADNDDGSTRIFECSLAKAFIQEP